MSILYISDKIRKSGSEIHYSYKNPWWWLGSMNEDKQRVLYLLKVENFVGENSMSISRWKIYFFQICLAIYHAGHKTFQ
jgi:hypothetical protein